MLLKKSFWGCVTRSSSTCVGASAGPCWPWSGHGKHNARNRANAVICQMFIMDQPATSQDFCDSSTGKYVDRAASTPRWHGMRGGHFPVTGKSAVICLSLVLKAHSNNLRIERSFLAGSWVTSHLLLQEKLSNPASNTYFCRSPGSLVLRIHLLLAYVPQ